MQISKYLFNHPNYPESLRDIPSPPKQLFVVGQLPTGPAVAIVGSRRPTEYGKAVTYRLASELASAGVVIVSGLAIGLDSVAHQAAIDGGGQTIAVQPGGLDKVYPASHRNLAIKIIQSGALVSEYDVGSEVYKGNFVARNRIESGLSLGVVVTEAAASSGTLITANFALQQNRLVMAVPGPITSPLSAGPNNLIKAGAIPVTDSSDVLAALNFQSQATTTTPVVAKSKEEAMILELLRGGVNSTQDLIEQSGLPANQFANVITLMEITGKVRNLGAGQWLPR